MKKNVIIIFLASLAIVLSLLNFFNTPRIAYINSSILLQKYSAAKKAQATLDEEKKEWEDNIRTLEKEINELNKEAMEKGASWSKSKLAKFKKKLNNKQKDYFKYRSAIEEKSAKREKELMQPVFDNLNSLFEEYGKLKHYDIIFGTVAGGNILFGVDKIDITDEFLKYANKKANNGI